nr:hypothetical protein [Tanacetum cinerariifolium]
MLVEQQVVEEGDADENNENVNAGDIVEGDVSTTHGEVPTIAKEPSIPSLTPPTPPPQPSHDIPLLPKYNQYHYNHLRRVKHLELDKISQALEITKLKRRVKKLERGNKVKMLKLRRLQKVGTTRRVETSDETVMDDVSNQWRMIADMDQDVDLEEAKEAAEDAKEDESKPAEVQEVVDVVTTTKIITEVVTAASKTITAASTNITAAKAQVPAATLTAAHSRRRTGVVIKDLQEESTTSTIIPAETKSKDKGKGILVEEPKPLKKQAQIKQDEKYARELEAELNKTIDWDEVIDHVKKKDKENPAMKRYQIDYFKGMSYDDIRPFFEAMFNTSVAFLQKTKEQIEEEESKALKRLNETPAEKAANRKKMDEEKNQRSVHGPAKANGGKLLESCGVQIITFTTTQLILLKERKYPLTRFTMDQMLNAIKLEVEEESEVSLDLLRFIRQQHQKGQLE